MYRYALMKINSQEKNMNRIIKNIFLVALVPIIAEIGLSSNINANEVLPAVQTYIPNLDTLKTIIATYMPHMMTSVNNIGAGLTVTVGSLVSLKSLWWIYKIFCSED